MDFFDDWTRIKTSASESVRTTNALGFKIGGLTCIVHVPVQSPIPVRPFEVAIDGVKAYGILSGDNLACTMTCDIMSQARNGFCPHDKRFGNMVR